MLTRQRQFLTLPQRRPISRGFLVTEDDAISYLLYVCSSYQLRFAFHHQIKFWQRSSLCQHISYMAFDFPYHLDMAKIECRPRAAKSEMKCSKTMQEVACIQARGLQFPAEVKLNTNCTSV